jgi:hypothetical protein
LPCENWGHQVPLDEAELLDGSRPRRRGHGNSVAGEAAAIKDQLGTAMTDIDLFGGRWQRVGFVRVPFAQHRGGAFDQSNRFRHL